MNCLEYAEKLSSIIREKIVEEEIRTVILSGGIDTTFVSLSGLGILKKAISVFYDKNAPDYKFAKKVAKYLGMEHYEVMGGSEEALDEVIKIMRTIDPIEVCCDVPIYLGLKKAKELGESRVITGDGGDELFLGYSFLLEANEGDLWKWIRKMEEKANFSSGRIGDALGIKVTYGLFFPGIIAAQKEIPISCRIGERGGRKYGKFLLRKYIEEKGFPEIAWRRKDPVMFGSGFSYLVKRWSSSVSRKEALELSEEYGIKFPSYAHVYLFKKFLELGLKPPKKVEKGCPICGSELDGNFCHFCGAYISDRGIISHYSDSLIKELRSWKRPLPQSSSPAPSIHRLAPLTFLQLSGCLRFQTCLRLSKDLTLSCLCSSP